MKLHAREKSYGSRRSARLRRQLDGLLERRAALELPDKRAEALAAREVVVPAAGHEVPSVRAHIQRVDLKARVRGVV